MVRLNLNDIWQRFGLGNKPSEFGNSRSPLVYPRELPAQVPTSREGIRSEDEVETKYLDYLRIQVYKTQGANGANPYAWVGQGGGGGFQEPYKGLNQSALAKTIYLYLPTGLKEEYGTNYNQTTLGAAGVGAAKAGGAALSGENIDAINTAQQTAGSMKPEFLMNTAASALGAVNSAAGTGGSMDANDLLAVTTKKVFNPYQETTFKGVNYRSHPFNFKMTPRNAKEALECYRIISVLRQAMLPSASSGEDTFGDIGNNVQQLLNSKVGSHGGARFLNIPDIFKLSLVRVETNDIGTANFTANNSPSRLAQIVRYPTKCVLTSLSVDVSPDGQYNSLKSVMDDQWDHGPAAMTLALNFQETQFITREMVRG